MAETTQRTKDEWVALVDNAIETAITTASNTTLKTAGGVSGIEKVTRAEVLKLFVRRAVRKGTQSGMRREMATFPVLTPGT